MSSKKITPESKIVGIKLVTMVELIGVKLPKGTGKKINYDKCIQMYTHYTKDSQELRFVPFNVYDRKSHPFPYRSLSISPSLVLYEYLPDIEILEAYTNLLGNYVEQIAH